MNRPQRIIAALALFAALGFIGFAVLPMGGDCGTPTTALFERVTPKPTNAGWDFGGSAVGAPTFCARTAGSRFRIAGIVGALVAIGLAGSFFILRDDAKR